VLDLAGDVSTSWPDFVRTAPLSRALFAVEAELLGDD
jgi:hypothetical protein